MEAETSLMKSEMDKWEIENKTTNKKAKENNYNDIFLKKRRSRKYQPMIKWSSIIN